MSKNKTIPTKESVTCFLNSIQNETRRKDGFFTMEVLNKVTGLQPVMWGTSIIGYGRYHYKYKSGHEGEAPLIGFSPRKQNLALYVLNDFPNQGRLLEKLGKHKTGKICLYINKLSDVNLDIFEQIIAQSYRNVKQKNVE